MKTLALKLEISIIREVCFIELLVAFERCCGVGLSRRHCEMDGDMAVHVHMYLCMRYFSWWLAVVCGLFDDLLEGESDDGFGDHQR